MIYLITSASGFEREAQREILEIVKGRTKSLFMKGLFVFESDGPVLEAVKEAETKYVGHVYPIQKEIRITKDKESVQKIADEAFKLANISKDEKFAVRCERRGNHEFSSRDIDIAVGNLIEAKVDLENPDKIIVVQIIQDLMFLSVLTPDEIVSKQVTVSKKYEKRPLNRAEFKMSEAFEAFEVEPKKDWRVLDIGAAPGGWSKVLSEQVKEVVAVDPAELKFKAPNVWHLKIRIENLPANVGKFDMIVNDMNLDPVESAELMCNLAKLLKTEGIAIMTVKFITRERKKHIAVAEDVLSRCFKDFKTKRLPHNKLETTIMMRRT